MLRKYINSFIGIGLLENGSDIKTLFSSKFIIQTETIGNDLLLVEYCNNDEICDLIPFTSNSVVNAVKNDDATVNEYREIVLNNDPFNKYSGQKLGFIFDNKDINWVKSFLSKSVNSYMKERVKYLAEFYKVV